MVLVLVCAGSALIGYGIGLLMADRIAEHKIQEMRLQMGLNINTGEPIGDDIEELYKELYEKDEIG